MTIKWHINPHDYSRMVKETDEPYFPNKTKVFLNATPIMIKLLCY